MAEELNAGLELMMIGMGIVFLFLFSLILIVNVMSKLIQHFYKEPELVPAKAAANASNGIDAPIVAAITTAVHRHRANN